VIIVLVSTRTVLTRVMLLTTGKVLDGHRPARSHRPDVRMLRPPLDRSIRTPDCDDNTNMTRLPSKGNELNKLEVDYDDKFANSRKPGVKGEFPTTA